MFGKPILHGDYLTPAVANATYLRLDTANDPLTGGLVARDIRSVTDGGFALGTSNFRWDRIYAMSASILSGSANAVSGSSVSPYGTILGTITKNGLNGIARIVANPVTAGYYFSLAKGEVRKTGTDASTVEILATGGASFATGLVVSAGGIAALRATGEGSFASGIVNSSNNGGSAYLLSAGRASFARGNSKSTTAHVSTIAAFGNGAFVNGYILGGATSTISASGTSSTAWGYIGAAGGTVSSSQPGSFAQGFANGGTVIANGVGSMARGTAVGANASVLSSGLSSFASGDVGGTGTGTISSTAQGTFASGAVYNGGTISATFLGAIALGASTNGGQIRSTQQGAFAGGSSAAGGDILASGLGSFAHGFSFNNGAGGDITASGAGSFANGRTNNGPIRASGLGSFACGYGRLGVGILASGYGNMAVGYAAYAGVITASGAMNCFQFGQGVNSVSDSLRVGTSGLHFKGSTGAFGTPLNGQFWMGSTGNAFIQMRSNGANVTMGPVNTWTAGVYATRRSFAGLTAPVVTAYGAAITEDRQILETLIEDLRIANII